MTGPEVPLGAPVPCETPPLSVRLSRDEQLLSLLFNMFPGWRVELRPVTFRNSDQVEVWWWAQRRTPPTAALQRAGVLGCWMARPTGDGLMSALSRQLAIVQDQRG